MTSLLLAVIYLAFIGLGLPDSLLGAAWPMIYPQFGVPVSSMGLIGAVRAIAIDESCSGIGEIAVPNLIGALRQVKSGDLPSA